MQLRDLFPLRRVARGVITCGLLCLVAPAQREVKADLISVVYPKPWFPPNVPTFEADDSYISYHYVAAGTGWWQGDPEYHLTGLDIGTSESISCLKTNGSWITSTTNNFGNARAIDTWCPGVDDTFTSFFCFAAGAGCPGAANWYVSDNGLGPNVNLGDPTDIREGPTTVSLPCGTLTTGKSYYEYTVNPDGTAGGACGRVPKTFMMGAGCIQEINLELTPGCTSSSIVAPGPFWVSACQITPSTNTMTPSGGFIDQSGSFHASFQGHPHGMYRVHASTNLSNWEPLCFVELSTNSTGSFTDAAASSHSKRFYLVEGWDEAQCSDAVGYVRLTLPPGYSMIANPLFSPTNTISALLPDVPESTTLQFWGDTNWLAPATFNSGAWDIPRLSLRPGAGALMHLPSSATLTFIGQVICGRITNAIPQGTSIVSSVVPQTGQVGTALGLTGLHSGDTLSLLTGTNFTTYTYSGGAWLPAEPVVSVGQSAIVHSSQATSWDRLFPTFDVYALSEPIIAYTYETPDWANTLFLYWDVSPFPLPGDARPIGPVPEGAVLEVFAFDLYRGSIPLTEYLLSWITPPDESISVCQFAVDQGTEFKVRYRNGDFVGPFSNVLPYHYP